MATAVPKCRRLVCSAIRAPGRKGSWMVSVTHNALKPISSAAQAMAGMRDSGVGGRVASRNIILTQKISDNPLRRRYERLQVGALVTMRGVYARADQRHSHVAARPPIGFPIRAVMWVNIHSVGDGKLFG